MGRAGTPRPTGMMRRGFMAAVGVLALSVGGLAPHLAPAAGVTPTSVLGWGSGVARDLPPAVPITVYFNRAMDRAAVRRAWRLSPAVRGSFHWGATSVSFRPAHSFRAGTVYRLSVGVGARSLSGIPLGSPFTARFSTGDALRVTHISPWTGTQQVPASGQISISFNHPMVPLAGLSVPAANPPGWNLHISPALAGHGVWRGTSTWVYVPDRNLQPSTHYSVSLAGSARDSWGNQLAHGMNWSFSTITPDVFSRSPHNAASFVDPRTSVSLTFNQLMDHVSTARAFSLSSGGAAVAGSITWKGPTLVFKPDSLLDGGRTYLARVSSAARSANRRTTLHHTIRWSFDVAPAPKVTGSDPVAGGTAYEFDNSGPPYCPGYCASITFSTPMSKASLDKHLTITPTISHLYTAMTGDNNGNFAYVIYGDYQPSSSYTVTIAPGVVDAFGRPLPGGYTFYFKTAPHHASIALYGMPNTEGISFSAGQVAKAPVQFLNISHVQYTLIRTNLYDLSTANGSEPAGTPIRQWSMDVPHPLDKVQNLTVSLAAKDGSPLPPGLYWLEALGPADSPGLPPAATPPQSAELVAVVDTSLTVKSGQNGTLVWATSPQTGNPVAGVRVRLTNQQGSTATSAVTDSRGLHFFPGYEQNGRHYVFAAVASDGGHFGIAKLYWTADTSSPSFLAGLAGPCGFGLSNGLYSNGPPPPASYGGGYGGPCGGQGSTGAYFYTDRPVYRPGQRVHFRALLWRDRDGVYSLLGSRQATIQANSATGRQLYRAQVTLDKFGAVRGSFGLPGGTPTGTDFVNISLANGPGIGGAFTVAEYRKPEFLTAMTSTRPDFIQGQTLHAIARVRYVFDAPVVHRPVSWTAYTQPIYPQPPGWDQYSFFDFEELWQNNTGNNPGNGSQFGKQIAAGAGHTDAKGRLPISLPVKLPKSPADESVTVEATAMDVNHQPVSGRIVVPLYHAEYAIGLYTAHQVQPSGQPVTVDVAAVHPDGTPLKGQSLTATVYRRTYTNKLVQVANVGTEWKAVPHDQSLSVQSLTTDAAGKASLTFTPAQGGEYRVSVDGKDSLGNTAHNAFSISASAEGFTDWGGTDSTSLNLKPDQSTYRVGDTAHILVPSPFAGATALITTERGTIRSEQVLHLAANSSTVDIPITLQDVPNIYVTVTLYHGFRQGTAPAWRYGVAELHVRVDPRHLIIHLKGDGYRHRPGDRVTYTVTTTDSRGRPVSAELSLALVDKAVLALQDESNPDILQALYAERPLGVTTASEGTLSIDHLQINPSFVLQGSAAHKVSNGPAFGPAGVPPALPGAASRATGGGGGGNQPVTVRSHFADTAYWSGALVTNAAGKATVRLTLPDNTTTWRLDARGVTASQSAGGGQLQTLATQDLVLRPVLPRFFQVGDTLRIGAVLNNTLARAVRVRVSLATRSIHLLSSGPRTISLPPHADRLVSWPVSVPNGTAASILLHAQSLTAGVRGDAVRIGVPIHRPLTDETVATAGQVYGSIRQDVILPRGAVRVPGALTVQVSSALTAGLGAAYGQFRPWINESNDETANRVLVANSLRSLPQPLTGISTAAYHHLPLTVALGVQRLLDKQYGDGGWPWFDSPEIYQSDPLITADALQALAGSGRRGPLVRQSISRAQAYLRGQAENPMLAAADRVHILAVLAESGTPDRIDSEALYSDSIRRSHLDAAPLADLGMALALSHDRTRAATIVSALDGQARASASGAHWESDGWYVWSTPPIASTAEVLTVLTRLSPHDPLVPAAVRWLMLARQGVGWDGGRDTAQAIASLATYARASREGTADYQYRILVNGRTDLAGRYTPATTRRVSRLRMPVSKLPATKSSNFVVGRVPQGGTFGPGPLYYLADLHYYLRATAIAPRAEGVSVSRRYLDLRGQPVSSVAAESALKVEITVHTDQSLLYLDLQDPLPSGCEAIDGSLNTSQQGLFGPPPAWWWGYGQTQDLSAYLVHTDLRDNRVSLYAYFLPPGTYRYTYLVEATVPGSYGVSPTHVSETFFPEVFGRSAGQELTVR